MRISHLELFSFRNYAEAQFEFDPHANVIYGRNGEGKTNILEAIFLLGTLRSFRSNDQRSLIQAGKEETKIKGKIEHHGIEKNLGLSITAGGKKASINEKLIKKASGYLGTFYAVSFNPMDMHILQGGPQQRRQCLDRMLFNFDPLYGQELMSYYRILLQRNSALKFGIWEMVQLWWEKLCRLAAKIILKRLQFIQKLTRLTSDQYRAIAGANVDVVIQYHTDVFLSNFNNITEEDLLSLLEQKQKKTYQEERRLKRSLVGPHRDDFSVTIDGNDLRKLGSQGEQRTAILAIKLSELEALEEQTGLRAVVLLDDIASELDDDRRRHLFELLDKNETQIFVTTTDRRTAILPRRKAKFFHIEEGQLRGG